ncbi:adenylate/guanylate cyclase domain-containing protein [Granulosicoccus sp. 3-233]|uniref:adenylate/guanylate cyclase domain-containing protein n=1 Tax=Granulosicoccus sp. 3-233 TaxID=3417969 RepID=UPI003D334A00
MATLTLPYYNPGRRSLTYSLVLLLALTLLVLTGLGVFRLYFGFEWTAGSNDSGQLFTLSVRGGRSFNLFEADSFGRTFWSSLLILLLLCLLMPLFRLAGAAIIALLSAAALVYCHLQLAAESSYMPMEFELLIVLILFVTYVLLGYIGEVRDRKRVQRLLSQYVPVELAREYQRDPQSVGRPGVQREISVLFCDVVGFTAKSEQLTPSQLAEWLNMYFSYVSRIVVRYRGSIDKYMGDSVMAVWGAPSSSRTHAHDALCAGMDIQAEVNTLNERYRAKGLPEVVMGIGISTGTAMVGPLGSEYRVDYTVVGDSVNVAQRLEAQTRKYRVPIIVGDKTAAQLPGMVFRELDTVTVTGRSQPVTMYEPLGARETLGEQVMQRVGMHDQAMAASRAGDWDTAIELFSRLREEWGPISMYDLYLRGIEQARNI